MLNSNTKRKINNARDILVGKIPMPTTQVEQITLALIYKFMADMDKRSKALGDTSGFFANGYEQYSWEELMDKSLPARDRVKLYGEGLEKMSTNPHIPQLFRNIFRNAFLPFNDPETLKLFLDQIDQFDYEHSEELGNAFEYLLSSMSSQGDAGQFRTPRHIIDFIVQVVDPKKTDRILDPACGTAGFLISAYKHLVKNGLKNDELKNVSQNFVGYDISHDMVRLSLVNLYLHHFPDPHIYEYDTLTSEDRWDDDFDVILANPPFMTPKGGIKPHNRFSISSKRSEVLFTDYIMEHLSVNGKAGVIVPEGIIFQSQNAYKNLRKMMIDDDYLWAVVSLPSGVFNPYSVVKTSILLFDKTLAKKTNKILFVKVENDGYGLGAQRRKIKKDDLPQALEVLQNYKQTIIDGKDFETKDDNFAHLVGKSKIRESGDWNLSGERYKENTKSQSSNYEMVEIDNVCEVNPKKSEVKNLDQNIQVSFLPMSDLNENKISFKVKETRSLEDAYKGYTYFKNNDVLLAKITPCFENGKAGLATGLSNGIGFGSTEYHVLRANKEKILPKLLYYFVTNDLFRKLGCQNMTGSAGQKRVPADFIKKFRIPLPPLSVQQEIVEELDRYQKIIDGARQVVDNYQPEFEIEDSWKVFSFKDAPFEIIDGDRGKNYPKKENFTKKGYCLFLSTKNVRKNGFLFREMEFISKEKDSLLRKGKLKRNDIVLTTRGTIGNVGFYSDDVVFDHIRINSGMLIFRPQKKIFPQYLFYFFQSQLFHKDIEKLLSGSAQPQLPIKSLKKASFILPPFKIQKKIISQIQEEQKIIDSNEILIKKFEEKIKRKIEETWRK